MYRKIFSAIGILLGSFLSIGFAQGLPLGAELPIKVFENVLNVDGGRIDLSQNSSELTILDFWETNCSGCIRAFSKMKALQEKFKGRVRFVLINQSSRDSTIRFFNKRSLVNHSIFPLITEDKALNRMFPHLGVPYCVWLDKNLRVIGFGAEFVNERYIIECLGGKTLPKPARSGRERISPILNYDYEGKFRFISMITRSINGYTPEGLSDSMRTKLSGMTFRNLSIEMLYRTAFSRGKINMYGEAIVLFEVKDSAIIKYPKSYDENWYNTHRYSYYPLVPKSMENRRFEFMQEDLNRYFGYKVTVKKIPYPCIVLCKNGKSLNVKSNGGEPKSTLARSSIYRDVTDSIRELRNLKFENLQSMLMSCTQISTGRKFVDETGIREDELIDIRFSAKAVETQDLQLINKELDPYGLKLVEKVVELDTLIIRDE